MYSILGAAAASASFAAAAWAVRGPSSRFFGPSVWRGTQGRRAIALTFDDGPSPATPAILDILDEYDIPATFFQCGVNVRRAPELSLMVAAGPHEIGNHSDTHPMLALSRPGYIRDEFARAQETITQITRRQPVLLRPPYGVRWFGFRRMQEELRLRCIMWTTIGLDWKLDAPGIVNCVLSGIRDGGIVCLHDGRGTLKNPDVSSTVEAVRRIVPLLLAKGYHFETVSQLITGNGCRPTN